eukprot:2976854-Rhodomonas_salina.1
MSVRAVPGADPLCVCARACVMSVRAVCFPYCTGDNLSPRAVEQRLLRMSLASADVYQVRPRLPDVMGWLADVMLRAIDRRAWLAGQQPCISFLFSSSDEHAARVVSSCSPR